MKKSILTAAIAATFFAGIATTAEACSRLVTETDYGTILIRSADWESTAPFDGHARIFPVNSQREMRGSAAEYKNAMRSWRTKYHSVSFEEHGAFAQLSGQAVNDQGLSVMALSQHASEHFLADHQKHDNGAPAVNVSDLATYIAENYASTAEVKAALDKGEFQIAWSSAPNGMEAPAPLHFSVVDKAGQILLIQLNQGGVEQYYQGDSKSDLRVKTNDPLQQSHREYMQQFDLTDAKVAASMPWGINPKDRNARLLAISEHFDFSGLSYNQTLGRIKLSFDNAAAVPFGIEDPATGKDYPSYFSFQFNLDNGDIWFRSMLTGD